MGSAHDSLPPHLRDRYRDVPEEDVARILSDSPVEYTDGLDDENHHSVTSKEVSFRDKYGRDRVRYEDSYVPTPTLREKALELHLGVLYSKPVTKDPAYKEVAKNKQMIVTCPYNIAETMIATNLRDTEAHYKWVDGATMLRTYLTRGDTNSIDILDGFQTLPHLYIWFGYYEAKNQYIPQVVSQIMGARWKSSKHCWIFVPQDQVTMASRWGASFTELKYVPWFYIPRFDDLEGDLNGPDSTEEKLRKQGSGFGSWTEAPSSTSGSASGQTNDNPGDMYSPPPEVKDPKLAAQRTTPKRGR